MQLHERDMRVLNYVAQFNQLTSYQIHQLIFPDTQSTNPMYRSLDRLVKLDCLAKLERRMVGGARGGSGLYVWQLGSAGWKLTREGRYLPPRAVRHHTLAIADTYLTLVRLERAGKLRVVGYSCEPDSWLTIDKYELKPDLYAELTWPSGAAGRIMFEIDQGSQSQGQITGKFIRYWRASQVQDDQHRMANVLVVFVAIDQRRADELTWLLERGAPEQLTLFRVIAQDKLADILGG